MQKPTAQLIDEGVNVRVDNKMTSTVPSTVQSIMVDTLHPKAFKNSGSRKRKKKNTDQILVIRNAKQFLNDQ